jgi:oxygen-independent coproporphyrinogen-3 oxidase
LSKCDYCDFKSYVQKEIDLDQYLKEYKQKIDIYTKYNKNITSIYFGGGTPSLLSQYFVYELVQYIKTRFSVCNNAEITLEANPRTLDIHKALAFKEVGVNRISIGVQSIYDDGLQSIGRRSHTAREAIECVKLMASIFDNVSVDLIYNRPGQTTSEWKKELTETIYIFNNIQHISCYELILEKNTKLSMDIESGNKKKPIDTDEFLDITHDILDKNGFEMYEVSNFAKNGFYGRSNLSYWRYEDYYGVGDGAHSRVTVDDATKIAIEQVGTEQIVTKLTEQEVIKEKIIMGLRSTLCGIDEKFINDIQKITKLEKNSYIICKDRRVIITYEGLKRLNLVIRYILDV